MANAIPSTATPKPEVTKPVAPVTDITTTQDAQVEHADASGKNAPVEKLGKFTVINR